MCLEKMPVTLATPHILSWSLGHKCHPKPMDLAKMGYAAQPTIIVPNEPSFACSKAQLRQQSVCNIARLVLSQQSNCAVRFDCVIAIATFDGAVWGVATEVVMTLGTCFESRGSVDGWEQGSVLSKPKNPTTVDHRLIFTLVFETCVVKRAPKYPDIPV